MRWFNQFAIRIVFLLASTVSAVSIHRGLPSGLLSQLLTNPDGSSCERPCLFGIRPEDTLGDALSLFHAHPFIRRLKLAWEYKGSMRFSAPGMMVAIDADNGRWTTPLLISVALFPATKAAYSSVDSDFPGVNLGEVLSLLGEPEAVYIGFDRIMLFYFGNHLLVNVDRTTRGVERLDPSSTISAIVLTAAPGGIRVEGNHTRWLGFTTLQRYEQGEP